MKRLLSVAVFCLLTTQFIQAQNEHGLGYTTTDLGAELQYSPLQTTAGLHLAFNFPFHHGINLRLNYHKADYKDNGNHNSEKGSGFGLTLGYRYYFLLRPHGFFLGARHDLNRMEIDWKQGLTSGTSIVWASQPQAELGYMALINDQVFVTPAISAGYNINLKTDGQTVREGAVFYGGISVGYKF